MKFQPMFFAFLTFLAIPLTVIAAEDIAYTPMAPVIDGTVDSQLWERARWKKIDKLLLGVQPEAEDFSGRYKLLWNEDRLFLLMEFSDDILHDSSANPLERYWDDDALEIFIDEDRSGGHHLDNYNAFAYHLSLDGYAIDIGPEGAGDYSKHVASVWRRQLDSPHRVIWEASIAVYDDQFSVGTARQAKPVVLRAGKRMGFMVAYCDSDGTDGRQHFVSDVDIEPVNGDKNRGYIDASVFGEIHLIKE